MLRPTRLLALGGLVVIALFYWKPLRTYEHTRAVLDRRQADVSRLQQQQRALEKRLTSSCGASPPGASITNAPAS